jgi:hypothetical protein
MSGTAALTVLSISKSDGRPWTRSTRTQTCLHSCSPHGSVMGVGLRHLACVTCSLHSNHAANCVTPNVVCPLPTAHCPWQQPTAHCPLHIACCPSTAPHARSRCPPLTAHCSPPTSQCHLTCAAAHATAHCMSLTAHCMSLTAHCVSLTAHCSL